jgi:hypothetical protein
MAARRESPGFLHQIAMTFFEPQRPPLPVRRLAQDARPVAYRGVEGAPAQGKLLQPPPFLGRRLVLVGFGIHDRGCGGDDRRGCGKIIRQHTNTHKSRIWQTYAERQGRAGQARARRAPLP